MDLDLSQIPGRLAMVRIVEDVTFQYRTSLRKFDTITLGGKV